MVGGDAAVGEGVEGVGEDVDEGGGENNAGGEAFDDENGFVVDRFAVEEASEEDRRGDADDAGDEDEEDGDEFEVGGGESVATGRASIV